jgi:hypothetical protein
MLCVLLSLCGVLVVLGAVDFELYTITEMLSYSALGLTGLMAGMVLYDDEEDEL